MKLKKLLISVLSLIMSFALLISLSAFTAFAAEDEDEEEIVKDPTKYLTTKYNSAEEKLNTMVLYTENDKYAIYGLEETGEVGILDKTTSQIMLTNPYDVATSMSSDAVKEQLLSQIILSYSDSAGAVVSFNSFADAAFAADDTKQITMQKTRNGLRVEYTIGREATKYIVPRQIEKTSFEEQILAYFEEGSKAREKLEVYYTLKDPDGPNESQTSIDAMYTKWPITKKYPIYVLDTGVGNRELLELEGYIINTYYDEYAKVEEMYEMLDYVDTSAAPALFRFAIEYGIDDMGIEINLPASSIRYDSSNYTLNSVKFLPYFSAGTNENTGFTLVPDGSGTITRFEDIADKAFTLTGKLYGRDYSFHSITGSYQETMRLPVYGLMQTGLEGEDDSQGYVAYLVEGDAMAELTADHGGTVHKYNSVYTTFYPKPSDTYVLEGISTSGSATWNVQSDRRYTGNYKIRILPISGNDCDYNDMAAEIRDYLVESGIFDKMSGNSSNSEDVPLYLETFGTIKTSQKIAGFPVKLHTPLTTFEDTKNMLDEMRENGISNVNVRLTGWANGGLESTAPSKLHVEKAVGGEKGLVSLAEYAKENGVGLYPDLDFTYVGHSSTFDKFDFKKDSVKTIDNRSASYRLYSPLYQGFEEYGKMIISPNSASKFYDDIKDNFVEFGTTGISAGTLGSELSSDHNTKYALNREDVKQIYTNILSEMKTDIGSVMVNAGNAYTLPYADHVLGVSLDSSLNINTSESIPFVGMILHGNVEFTGSPINLDGDFEYSVLKAIENGANLYFVLSKDNTSELKQFEQFSKYYAIDYEIWKEKLFETYSRFNESMKKVKYSYIVDHETVDEKIVKVVYENGVGFILNYNAHDVVFDGMKIENMNYIEFDASKEIKG